MLLKSAFELGTESTNSLLIYEVEEPPLIAPNFHNERMSISENRLNV